MSKQKNLSFFCTTFILYFFILKIHGEIYSCDSKATCGCSTISNTSINAKIVGGEIVRERIWPWMISLEFSGKHICGASLINENTAVTAAHCVDDLPNFPMFFSIVAGVNQLSDSSNPRFQRRTVTKIIIHPQYDTSYYFNDIALLQFIPLSVSDSSTVGFVCLPKSNEDPFEAWDDLVATGWGRIIENGELSDELRQVTVKHIPSTAPSCSSAINSNPNITICAGIEEGGKDTCQGDSGGPLLAFHNKQWILVGITSSGEGCAQPGKPGIYTRVSKFIEFIDQQLGNIRSTTSMATSPTTTTENFTIDNHVDNLHSSLMTLLFGLVIYLIL